MSLFRYVLDHTDRNACRCGQCFDQGQQKNLVGHTVNMFHFDVCAKNHPDKESFVKLINEYISDYPANPLDGEEHSYIEIGAWIGDQGVAFQFMALGKILGLWNIMHPGMLPIPEDLQKQMAGMGYISIVPLVGKQMSEP